MDRCIHMPRPHGCWEPSAVWRKVWTRLSTETPWPWALATEQGESKPPPLSPRSVARAAAATGSQTPGLRDPWIGCLSHSVRVPHKEPLLVPVLRAVARGLPPPGTRVREAPPADQLLWTPQGNTGVSPLRLCHLSPSL